MSVFPVLAQRERQLRIQMEEADRAKQAERLPKVSQIATDHEQYASQTSSQQPSIYEDQLEQSCHTADNEVSLDIDQQSQTWSLTAAGQTWEEELQRQITYLDEKLHSLILANDAQLEEACRTRATVEFVRKKFDKSIEEQVRTIAEKHERILAVEARNQHLEERVKALEQDSRLKSAVVSNLELGAPDEDSRVRKRDKASKLKNEKRTQKMSTIWRRTREYETSKGSPQMKKPQALGY